MKEAEISVGGSIVAVADTGDCYGPDEQPELMLGRGYAGHEHLPWFGLINMNARLYDPAVHRFLSPDPEVQLPDNTQNYNRYTYCLNNPLRYSDPTGRLWLKAVYGTEHFYFYDENVKSLEDLHENYKHYCNISIVDDDTYLYIMDANTGEYLNEFQLLPGGDFLLNGNLQLNEYNRAGILHIGNLKYSTDNKNIYGRYLGPRNPKRLDGGDSYFIPPIDWTDYYAYRHDIAYDKLGAAGPLDAFLM